MAANETTEQPANNVLQPPPIPEGVKSFIDIKHGQVGGRALLLDLHLPEKPAEQPLPVIAYMHGGGWRLFNKTYCYALPLINKGYAVVSVGYRLSDEACFPAQIQDCKAAIRWVRANAQEYNLDPGRIGVCGASAGGHLAALMGTSGDIAELEGDTGNAEYSSRVQAVVAYCGVYDFLHLLKPENRENSKVLIWLIDELLGVPAVENLEKAVLASPITHISGDEPPFFIAHGAIDETVPFHQSELHTKQMEAQRT